MQCFPYCVTYCFQRKRKLSNGNFTCSCCPSPDGVHGVRNNAVFPIRMTSIIVWPLFYVTTVVSKFPSARLRYKTSTCNEQRALLDVARFCLRNVHILSLLFKCGVHKPNIKCNTVYWNMWTSDSRQIGRVATAALSAIARYFLSEAAMRVLRQYTFRFLC